jgi:RNA polymerase sigma factor (sigma-70 family)
MRSKKDSIEDTIKNNIGLIYMQLKRFSLIGDTEAESIAYEALWKAAKNYDKSRGNKFSTLAVVYIYNALCNYKRKISKYNSLNIVSYDLEVTDNGSLADIIASEEDIAYDIERTELRKYAMDAFNVLLKKSEGTKRNSIMAVWKREHFSCTAAFIANELDLTPSYVSQVLRNIKHSLRKELEKYHGFSGIHNK